MSPVYGLVVCGGKSSRMGTDKSLLNYHGQPQRYHLYQMLQPFCERVILSVNSSQAPDIPSEYEYLVDDPEYADIGPMGALLTAFKHYPDASFLMVGCDYPFIEVHHLHSLLKVKDESIFATAYYNMLANLHEPLLSHYQKDIFHILTDNFNLNNFSLQSVLKEVSAAIIVPDDNMIIRSIDTPIEFENVLMHLRSIHNDNAFESSNLNFGNGYKLNHWNDY